MDDWQLIRNDRTRNRQVIMHHSQDASHKNSTNTKRSLNNRAINFSTCTGEDKNKTRHTHGDCGYCLKLSRSCFC